ncbi:Nucleolar protein 14 [Sesamum alatum]|uniref:Nucleolar protein 14 n=1 Tax=Sesamum alatum TaxID=300844 RepID=A0AAE2CIR4_9LAMI|nr:Nucleolar protein 14 [Sesamum alatum]
MAKNSSTESSKKKKNKNKKNIKSKLSVLNSEAKKTKGPKENPFESIWSRRKFDILGKKRKDDERRRVGLSRSLAIQKRQKTLLKEYEQSTKSSVFVDKRIGEKNEGLEEFDKAILRSQRERQLKLKKKSKYNLSDGEEDEFEIQDGGYFPERDDFEDEEPLDEDEADQSIGSGRKLILGRGNHHEAEPDMDLRSVEGQENRQKTKKEVMEDIIFKSKFFKAQKAKDKEENEQFIEQLDKDFASLVQSEALLSLTQPNKMRALKALVNNSISNDSAKKQETTIAQNKVPPQQEKPDHYDKLVGEMALDMRARPSDRTKTPEELAQDEKERLERLEEERQKRMVAADDSSNEDANSSEEDDDESSKQIRHISGDDLGDSFSHEAKSTKVGWIDEILRRKNASEVDIDDAAGSGESEEDDDDDDDDDDEDEDEDEDEEEGSDRDQDENNKAQSLKDWEQSDDDNIETNLEEEEEDDDDDDEGEGDDGIVKRLDMVDQKKISESKGKQKDNAGVAKVKTYVKEDLDKKEELPYTIEAPKNFEEFSALLENRSDDQILEAIKRIRTYNAITIAAENRKKNASRIHFRIYVFYGVLLQYFAVLANTKPLNFKLLNMLVKPLMEMSAEIPYFAAICARQRLLRTRTHFCEDVKNTGKSCWPSLKTLFLLRLWSMIFPCSDFRHAVMTPAILLMSEYLMRCPITFGRDIAIGSFLCSMVLSVSRQSQKFCPEAITFIQTMLMAALKNKRRCEASQLYHLMELKTLRPLLCIQGHVEKIDSLDFLMLMDLPDDSPYFASDMFRASILFAIIRNLRGFVSIYEGLKSFPEIFLPISKILHELVEEDQIPDALKVEIKDVAQHIESKSQEHNLLRQPLRLRKQKIIKTAVPKFEENFVKGRDYDPDRERAEMKKLKKRLKQEAKGAVRELRKDNHFLLDVKERDKARMEEEKAEKYGKYRAFLQEQEHAFKSGQLGKGRKRRR